MATKTLFVGNLPYSVTQDQFLAHFSNFEATNARIIEGRGFGFIDVESHKMAEAIEATNMKDLAGRTLAVNEAQPRASGPRPNGGRPSGSSYGGGQSNGGGYGSGRSSGGGRSTSSNSFKRW